MKRLSAIFLALLVIMLPTDGEAQTDGVGDPPARCDFLSPIRGPVGSTVSIFGVGLAALRTEVTISGLDAEILSLTDTRIDVVVPNGATSGPVVVTVIIAEEDPLGPDDLVRSNVPEPREPCVRAVVMAHHIQAEFIHPQREGLVEIGDAHGDCSPR